MNLIIIIGSIIVSFIIVNLAIHLLNRRVNAYDFLFRSDIFDSVSYHEYDRSGKSKISGIIDDIKIDLEIEKSKGDIYIFVKAAHELPLSVDTKITLETTGSKLKKGFGIEDCLTGDSNFDQKMLLLGNNEMELHSLLSHSVRKMIHYLTINSDEFVINSNYVSATKYFKRKKFYNSVNEYVHSIVSFCKNLEFSSDYKIQIIKNTRTEKNSSVQKRNIEILATHFDNNKEVRDIFKRLLGDPGTSVQITAAKNIPDTGMAHLVSLLQKKDYISDEDLIEIIQSLNYYQYSKSVKAMEKAYKKTDSIAAKREILLALKKFQKESSSPFLIDELPKADPDLAVNLIEALGACGTVKAVEILHRYSKNTYGALIMNAVNKAIAQIQSRLGDVDKGWLSVEPISETDGALSISDEAGEGALSVDGDDKE